MLIGDNMKIGIASDHNGIDLKKEIIMYLNKMGYTVLDLGPTVFDAGDDYPDYAFKLGNKISDGSIDYGILICGTGIGMSIACNKVKGVRCAKVNTIKETRLTRIDNDANVIAISMNLNLDKIKRIIDTFINTPFSNEERHHRRVGKITNYEH